MKPFYLWVIPLTIIWPVLQIAIFIIRFGNIKSELISESSVFLPMGLISAIVLIFLINKAKRRRTKISAGVGYLIMAPIAFIGSLMSGLLLPPLIGTLIYGGLPLIFGTIVGYVIGSRWD